MLSMFTKCDNIAECFNDHMTCGCDLMSSEYERHTTIIEYIREMYDALQSSSDLQVCHTVQFGNVVIFQLFSILHSALV